MVAKKALLVVDIQNDFCPGGALGVKDGDKIIPIVNRYIDLFIINELPVFFSRDWHPEDTIHFKARGGQWPPHCIQNTSGAEFHPDLHIPGQAIIISKGANPDQDGYSAFDARNAEQIPFLELLRTMAIKELYLAGIATDYCVRESSLDALKQGFSVTVLTDAIKAVAEEAAKRAIDEIVARNGRLKTFQEVSDEF